MENEIFELYNRCFPDYRTTAACFEDVLEPSSAQIIEIRNDKNMIIGFSMIHGNSIALLCVDEAYRNRGHGTALLRQSEKCIKNNGASQIILGRGTRYILQGVPADEHNSAVDFFKARGYSAEWESVNMCLSLADFDKSALAIPPKTQGINYRFADYSDKADKAALLNAVNDAEPEWTSIFESCADPVMLAVLNGRIAGFQILSVDGGYFPPNKNVGSIGCVGVIHEARNKGIGLHMVAQGADWLKQRGCLSIELRYVELVKWYKRIGFYPTGKQWMGEKSL